MVSYAQKTAVFASVIKSNPEISSRALGRRYAGTKFAMRTQDRNDFVKLFKQQLKEVAEYKNALSRSDVTEATKNKLAKVAEQNAYSYAKYNTRKMKKVTEKIYKPVNDLGRRTFNRFGGYTRDFFEFYG